MSNTDTVLIVEDEANIAGFMSAILTTNGYRVLRAQSGAEGVMLATSHCPDIVLLDLGLPDMDGMNFIKEVRKWSQMPIVVVSARTHEREKVAALDAGADDYVTKPFGTAELLARVRTALRHARSLPQVTAQNRAFVVGSLKVDYDKHRVYLAEEDVRLTNNEYRIVALLAQHAGRVLTHDFIIRQIWGPNTVGDNQILRVNMANIRRKIEKNPAAPEYIFTEIGVGYRMIEG